MREIIGRLLRKGGTTYFGAVEVKDKDCRIDRCFFEPDVWEEHHKRVYRDWLKHTWPDDPNKWKHEPWNEKSPASS
jgi:hypothetical protein